MWYNKDNRGRPPIYTSPLGERSDSMKFVFTDKKVTLPDSVHKYAEKKVGKLDRFFKEDNSTLLYVHVGHGSGDTAVILFKGGKAEDVNDFISRINRELSERNSEE